MTEIENNNAVNPDPLPLEADYRPPAAEETMPISHRKQLFGWIGAAVILIDQATKWQIEATIPLNGSLAPIPELYPYFQFTHIANTGSVFGILPQAKWIITILAIFVTFGIAYFNYRLPSPSSKLRLTLGLLFGGAVGNLIDRFRIGHVTDFMNFNLRPLLQPLVDIPILDWAVFNVADMAISAGIVLMIYIMLREPELIEEAERQLAEKT
ncbi:MAG: signal peptidase II [Chloroflexi bacterium]|nr:signal peptidase II [Chloroflexota bacterium]